MQSRDNAVVDEMRLKTVTRRAPSKASWPTFDSHSASPNM
jgi:hypothetical protein